jgi:colanic acid biosynthesis protein WcaH
MLPPERFLQAVRDGPLVSIDLVVRDPEGAVLLGYRRNRPARGTWFVPGGRVAKGERLAAAMGRISRGEIGLELRPAEGSFLGVFEHLYDDNFAGAPGIGTHYVVLAYQFRTTPDRLALPADQHSEYRWLEPAALLGDPAVHAYTKAYFA